MNFRERVSAMKTRWMKSVVAASGKDAPKLPYGRGKRHAATQTQAQRLVKTA